MSPRPKLSRSAGSVSTAHYTTVQESHKEEAWQGAGTDEPVIGRQLTPLSLLFTDMVNFIFWCAQCLLSARFVRQTSRVCHCTDT